MRHFTGILLFVFSSGLVSVAEAQSQHHVDKTTNAGAADHGSMDHGSMDHGSMDHGSMGHGSMDHELMDHTMHQDRGDESKLRDPHAYSEGFSRDDGPYIPPGVSPLVLADEVRIGQFTVDRLEILKLQNEGYDDLLFYDTEYSYGTTYDRLVITASGERLDSIHDAEVEVLWSHAVSAFWDLQTGVRIDRGDVVDREWLKVGLTGTAPYWIETDIALYLGESGQASLVTEFLYNAHLTQKLVLQPRVELTVYSKEDPSLALGRGLSSIDAGFRLRYEITPGFAPYVGVSWQSAHGDTKSLLRLAGDEINTTHWLAGLSFWF